MMKYNIHNREVMVREFKGINTGENYCSGELTESVNMSADLYPALCTRKERKLNAFKSRNITGIGNYEGIITTSYTDDGKIFFTVCGNDYEFTGKTQISPETKRSFASIGDTIMIIPDNLIFNVTSKTFSDICVNQSGSSRTLAEKFERECGNPSLMENSTSLHLGYVFHNKLTSRTFKYSSSSVTCDFYYFAFSDTLKAGDVIEISMVVKSDEGSGESYREYRKKMEKGFTVKIKEITSLSHKTANGTITETTELIFDDNTIDTNNMDDVVFEKITIKKTVPDLKQICSFNNRIWGITAKEICCSKLADASQWNDFSADAYGTLPYACFSTPASTEGEFTAITSFGNYIYAFKENAVHCLFGDSPDEFVLKTIESKGVNKSKTETLAKTDSEVFFCADDGIYSFNEGRIKKVSECLGSDIDFISAASSDDKYYVLGVQNGESYIYVYDCMRKLWHREDAEDDIRHMCRVGSDATASSASGTLFLSGADLMQTSSKLRWSFTVKFDEKLFEKNAYGKISVRYSLGDNAFFTVRAIYDDESRGAICGAKHDEIMTGGGCVHIPVRRCLNFRLCFEGMGYFCLKGLKLKYYRGSEI